MSTRMTPEQRQSVADRAHNGEDKQALAEEFGVTLRRVLQIVEADGKKRRAVSKKRRAATPATAEAAKLELLELFLRTVATMKAELIQYEALFQASAACGDIRALSTLEVARGIHIDKLNVLADSLTSWEKEVTPPAKIRVNLARKVAG